MVEIVVGTYEGFLLGYSLNSENELHQTFATHSHTGSIRCVSTSDQYFASGGTDDKIVINDLKSRKEQTVLMSQSGTINTLEFTKSGTHLLSGCEDGSLVVYRVGNWQIEKKWGKAHGGSPVISAAVHHTDKLFLSIGGDNSLKTWNLVKGRSAFTLNLANRGIPYPTTVLWAPDGIRFVILSQQNVDIWNIDTGGMEKRLTCSSKPSCLAWISNDKFTVGLESGNILLIQTNETKVNTYKAHGSRVKCLIFNENVLYSASSTGELRIWNYVNDSILTSIAFTKTGCRMTCMALNDISQDVKKEEPTDNIGEVVKPAENDNVSDDGNDDLAPTLKVDIPWAEHKKRSFVTVSYDDPDEEELPQKKQKTKKKTKKKVVKNT